MGSTCCTQKATVLQTQASTADVKQLLHNKGNCAADIGEHCKWETIAAQKKANVLQTQASTAGGKQLLHKKGNWHAKWVMLADEGW